MAAPRLHRTPRQIASVDIVERGVKEFLRDVEREVDFITYLIRLIVGQVYRADITLCDGLLPIPVRNFTFPQLG